MKINELIEKVILNDEDLHQVIEVKTYMPIIEKKKLAMDVVSMCTDEMDDFVTVNRFDMCIYFDMCVIREYTNIDISADLNEIVDQYDILCQKNLLQPILDLVKTEYIAVRAVLDCVVADLTAQNSLEAQIARLMGQESNANNSNIYDDSIMANILNILGSMVNPTKQE